MFDVDGLRDVNDSLGHAAGDKLLVEVASRLRSMCPPAALVGRVGGDEFVVTLRVEQRRGRRRAGHRAARSAAGPDGVRLADPRRRRGGRRRRPPGPRHRARRRCCSAPTSRPTRPSRSASGLAAVRPGLESRSVRRLGLAGDLRRALDNDELEVYFQPKVVPARPASWSASSAWPAGSTRRTARSRPEDFVAVAEHTGQLGRLTEVVLREGLRRCRRVGRRRPAAADRGQPVAAHAGRPGLPGPGGRRCSASTASRPTC